MRRRNGKSVAAGVSIALLCGLVGAGCSPSPAEPVAAVVSEEELLRGHWEPPARLPNGHFLPDEGASNPRVDFSGELKLIGSEMQLEAPELQKRWILDRDVKRFPDVSLELVSYQGVLIPLDRDLILSGSLVQGGSYWDVLVSPGRVWAPAGDGEWSRAAFPFALANSMENETYNGVATFLYSATQVSGVRYQIVRQTTPYYLVDPLPAWGQLAATYAPAPVEGAEDAIRLYGREVADRLPVGTWDELEARTGLVLDDFDAGIEPEHLITSALLYDGTLYVRDCDTELGPLPFCGEQRFGIWSVTKTTGNGAAMLRLAETYGPEIFDEKIGDHLDVTADHDGWALTTFGNVLDMATGVGEGSEVVSPNNQSDGYLVGYESWYTAMSKQARIAEVFRATNHSWGPGEVFRYRDQDAFLLGAAMDAYLEQSEGPDADIWALLMDEVYAAVGIQHAPTNRLIEADGATSLPQMSQGYYPTVDDLARIAQLMQNEGRAESGQILHAGKLAEALGRAGEGGLEYGVPGPDGMLTYHWSFWRQPYRGAGGCVVQIASMGGWGGHSVMLYPNGLVAIRIANEPVDGTGGHRLGMAAVADRIRPFCQ